MNPPSALHGAMSRDRKPFTYTPGGINLSEIKSERMAQRLIRNAMNPGVPEKPIHTIQSPPMPSTPIAVPNFNCLPVQVFPTFNLPANPKSLLRTRSIPDQSREPTTQRAPPPSHLTNNSKIPVAEYYDTFTKPTQPYVPVNNNKEASMYEYDSPGTTFSLPRNYGSSNLAHRPVHPSFLSLNDNDNEFIKESPKTEDTYELKRHFLTDSNDATEEKGSINETNASTSGSISIEKPIIELKTDSETINPVDGEEALDQKKEVKIVKKTVNQETKSEVQNGDQNGDIDAELVVKLPAKKLGVKTETKVEVTKRSLPDGSIEEITTTTTKTTNDGKTEIKTKTETRILPKEEAEEEIEEVEEEEVEEEENEEVIAQEIEEQNEKELESKDVVDTSLPKENGERNIIKTEERSESTETTTKRIILVPDKEEQEEDEEEVVEEEEIEEAEPVTIVIKKNVEKQPEPEEIEELIEKMETKTDNKDIKIIEKQEKEADEEEEKEEICTEQNKLDEEVDTQDIEEKEVPKNESEVEEDNEDEPEKEVEIEIKSKIEQKTSSEVVEENLSEREEKIDTQGEDIKVVEKDQDDQPTKVVEEIKKEVLIETVIREKTPVEDFEKERKEDSTKNEIKHEIKLEYNEPKQERVLEPEIKIPLREPSIPLEKVEDVEIKPIGPAETITKSRIENTEIITTGGAEKPTGLCTEYNRIENIVTINRTTKTLDQAYENITQQGIPTVKTYFVPSIDRISTSPLPSRPYQPVYPSVPTSERRHSLLLERLSVERQIPTDVYQYNTTTNSQSHEQQQWSQEPQAEVLTVSNIKPSSINQNNQLWYQQTRDSVVQNNVSPSPAPTAPAPASQTWNQSQPTYKPQPTYTPQPTYQTPNYQTPTYQTPTYQAPTYQTPTPQYQPTYTETSQERSSNIYSTYTPKPTWASTIETAQTNNVPANQYSYSSKDTNESYKETTQYSSSYVPPPWEQDSSYVTNNNQTCYQPPPSNTFTPSAAAPPASKMWKPTPVGKFSKPPPTAYIPPAPNQSFVKPVVVEPPRLPGRKTYYSEYERRYITVPESNYIPPETKFQPQPDPSPQYYYDNNEPRETVEHQWRKELREFAEKTSQTQTETNVKPPWEIDQNYSKTSATTYTPTPTWSQTVRPSSWRERSFESEYVSQEWPKTNTLGRGRPLSSYGKAESTIPERTRGVSVDRYNPNSYQSPMAAEHPPVQSHTLTTPTPHAYHNPNVPAYHARASAELRDQPTNYQHPRVFREPKASPFQSRSFKYLQWITGTDD